MTELLESKKVEIAYGVKCSKNVNTFVTDEEFAKCQHLISDEIIITDVVKNKIKGKNLAQHVENIAELILEQFEQFTEEEIKTLALKEFKTRAFQDSMRSELRNTLGLTTSPNALTADQKVLLAYAKNDPENAKAMLEYVKEQEALRNAESN